MTATVVDLAPERTDPNLRRRALIYAVLVFVAMRAALSLLGLTVGSITFNQPPLEPGTSPTVSPGIHNLWDGLDRLDAAWFTQIADQGYDRMPEHSAAFFPAYPLAIRAVSAIPGIGTLAAALLVSNGATFGSLVLLYILTARELSEDTARRTVLVLAAFPTSFFLLAPYSESLYLFAVLWSFSEARRRRWSLAGVAGAVAGATRQVGVIMAPVLVLAARKDDKNRRAMVWACAAAIGPLLYLGWWQLHTGDALAPFHAQAEWNRHFRFPLVTLARGLYEAWIAKGSPDGGYWISDAGLTILAVGGTIAVARKVPSPYIAFAALSIIIPLCYPYQGRDLLSMSRFVLPVFPAFWGMASWLRRRWALVAWLSVSAPLAAWHAILFMHYRHIY